MKKQYKPSQRIYRPAPCPAYDIAGMENWLADMAEDGFFLIQDGFFAGFAGFEYRGPQKAKYRLEAAQKNTSMWSEDGGEPDPEQVELSERYSWEYVAKRRDFYIYRSLDPSARELNTDPEVQALALNAVKKRQRNAIFNAIILLVVYPLLMTRGCPLIAVISIGSWLMALDILLTVLMIAEEVRAFVHLRRIQKFLTDEGSYPGASDRRKRAAAYFTGNILKTVLLIVIICSFARIWGISITDENKTPLGSYKGDLPFATMLDFAGEGSTGYTETMKGLSMGINTIQEKSDLLAPRCIYYNEHAKLRNADGKYIDGGLYIDYCELRSPTLAKIFTKEIYRLDKLKKRSEPLAAPELDADYAVAYLNDIHFPTVIIRKGSIVAKVYFYQTSPEYEIPMEDWAKIICDSLGK